MTDSIDSAIALLPELTRRQAVLEGSYDPRFWSYFTPLALSKEPFKSVDDDMRKAVANAMDPTLYPESSGRWPLLRSDVRSLFEQAAAIAKSGVSGLGQEGVMQFSLDEPGTGVDVGGPSIFETLGNTLLSLAPTALNIYSKYLTYRAGSVTSTTTRPPTAGTTPPITTPPATSVSPNTGGVVYQTPPPSEGLPTWATVALVGGGGLLAIFAIATAVRR